MGLRQHGGRRIGIAAAATLALGASACSGLPGSSLTDTLFIGPFLGRDLPGGDYSAELARAYQERAAFEAKTGRRGDSNWIDATAFYRKALTALEGGEPRPWDPAIFGLEGALEAGYVATLELAERHRDARPEACAQMVALFDHWVEQAREGADSVTPASAMRASWETMRRICAG